MDDRARMRATLPFLAGRLEDDPALVGRVVEKGLIPAPGPSEDPDALAWASIELRNRLMELAQADPLAAERLGLRPLDVLCCEDCCQSAPGPSLAVAFSDLAGFTRFTFEHGDAAAGLLLEDHYAAVNTLVDRHGGRVVKRIGDGHMLSFSTPQNAVLAAVEAVHTAPGLLATRVGVHYGSVVMTNGDLVGHVVNLAARLTDMAEGGTALVTADVRNAVGHLPGIAFDDPTPVVVHGLGETITVSAVRPA